MSVEFIEVGAERVAFKMRYVVSVPENDGRCEECGVRQLRRVVRFFVIITFGRRNREVKVKLRCLAAIGLFAFLLAEQLLWETVDVIDLDRVVLDGCRSTQEKFRRVPLADIGAVVGVVVRHLEPRFPVVAEIEVHLVRPEYRGINGEVLLVVAYLHHDTVLASRHAVRGELAIRH